MVIGILTFHWGTNYGGILQAYCLQEYLKGQGHVVEIINYKPSQYDISLRRVFMCPKYWKNINKAIIQLNKESKLELFRKKYLQRTKRFNTANEFKDEIDKYDIIISGSDQVLNPGFTCHGENGRPSSVYWLSVGREDVLRIGYAVSFGCEEFPKEAEELASHWVNRFKSIGTREKSGLKILDQLGFLGEKMIVPDPTLLLGARLFENLGVAVPPKERDNYICVYMLRHEIKLKGNVRYIDEKHSSLSMEEWLTIIVGSSLLVTNSYHGMIMAILSHVPFWALLEGDYGKGMNDRFYTLLRELELEDRISDYTLIQSDMITNDSNSIDWNRVDKKIEQFTFKGLSFLDIINNESTLV